MIIYFDYLFFCSVNVFHCLYANLLTLHIAICYHKTLNSSLIWAVSEVKKTTVELHLLPYFLAVVTFISHLSLHSWEAVAFSVLRQGSWTLQKGFEESRGLIPAYYEGSMSWSPREPDSPLHFWAFSGEGVREMKDEDENTGLFCCSQENSEDVLTNSWLVPVVG